MALNFTRLINSPASIRLVAVIGQTLPRPAGYRLADFVAGRIARQIDSPVVRAVRANQWVIRGESLGKEALDLAVAETLKNTAHSIFDLYHFAYHPQAAGQLIHLDAAAAQLARRPEFDSRGLMVVGLHISNFDLSLAWLCRQGMKPFILTIPNPEGGRRVEYKMRKNFGMNLVPASVTALRQALKHLQRGGIVLTGIDRPIPDPKLRPRFFGRPAPLPLHHIFLATKARVPIIIVAVRQQEDGSYLSRSSEPIEMELHSNQEMQTILNAEKVLHAAEDFIRAAPQQWSMSLAVWPETMNIAPH